MSVMSGFDSVKQKVAEEDTTTHSIHKALVVKDVVEIAKEYAVPAIDKDKTQDVTDNAKDSAVSAIDKDKTEDDDAENAKAEDLLDDQLPALLSAKASGDVSLVKSPSQDGQSEEDAGITAERARVEDLLDDVLVDTVVDFSGDNSDLMETDDISGAYGVGGLGRANFMPMLRSGSLVGTITHPALNMTLVCESITEDISRVKRLTANNSSVFLYKIPTIFTEELLIFNHHVIHGLLRVNNGKGRQYSDYIELNQFVVMTAIKETGRRKDNEVLVSI